MAADRIGAADGALPRATAGAQPGLSIVVPLHNEASNLSALHGLLIDCARALARARNLTTEVVYVDDGSSDATRAAARTFAADGLDVQVIALSRNFGKEAALLAGLDHARLGAVLFMDGDGQHPPNLVETLVARWLDYRHYAGYTPTP